MKKGSITVFSTLIMVLVASVLFVLLEGTRVQEIKRISQLQTDLALEAVFADYNALLWREYKLLATDSTDMQETLISYGNARAGASENGLNLLQTRVENISTTQLTLLTDGNGDVFRKAAAASMGEVLGFGVAQEIFNQYEVVKDLVGTSSWNAGWIELGASQELSFEGVNPLNIAKILQGMDILSLVLPNTTALSNHNVPIEGLVSNRTIAQGVSSSIAKVNWMENILFQQYLLKYMSNYLNPKEERGFAYELEYIIGGASSDVENLKAVVSQLLFIREIINFLYLTLDQTKYEEASLLAFVLAGISANPVVIETVKLGLLTAWAFGESVLDVRALLQGKKIPLLKSADTWTLGLENMGSIVEKSFSAKESKWGLSYSDYLGVLLMFQQDESLAFHAMDAQESTLRKQLYTSEIYLDRFLVQAAVEMRYRYYPVFYRGYLPWGNQINTKSQYGFY